jgi:hypothetical protein
VECTISFVAKEATTPSTTHGLTTPVFATNPTAIPWTNLSGGVNPLKIGVAASEVAVDTPSFSCSVTHNLERVKPNGQTDVKFVEPTLRDVTFEFDTWHKDTTLIADQKSLTARSMLYNLSSNRRLVFTDAFLESLGMSDATSATTPKIESYTGTAKAVAVATY